MRFMVFVPANMDSEAGVMPSQEQLTQMTQFNEEMAKAGIMLAGEGLQPTSKGSRIRFEGGRATVTEGPFPQQGLVAGYWLIQARDKDEAIAWMKRAPFGPGTEIEIRPLFEPEDFGPALTPELRARESRMREQITMKR